MLTLKILFWVALFIVFYTYIGYGILIKICVWIKERFHPWQEPQAPEVLPEVTLMIAAYNEELVVAEKMKNTRQLEYPADRFKVVWVTDGSTDATNERLAEYEEVTVLYQPLRQGKTAALNRGMTFVKSPIVIFTDANTMLNPEAIREIVRQFSLPEVGCVAGEKRIAVQERDNAASGGEGLYWRYESTLKRLDWHFYSAMGAAGELFAVRRELFRPMEPDTLLDDFILSLRIVQQGYRIAYCDTAYAVEGGSADMHEERKRKVRICAGGWQSMVRLRALLNPLRYGKISFMYISHRVLRWSLTPLCLLALLPLNLALTFTGSAFWVVLFVLQLLFYGAVLGGYYNAAHQVKNKVLFVPYYFMFMNLNVLAGLLYLQRKRGSGAWEKATRAA